MPIKPSKAQVFRHTVDPSFVEHLEERAAEIKRLVEEGKDLYQTYFLRKFLVSHSMRISDLKTWTGLPKEALIVEALEFGITLIELIYARQADPYVAVHLLTGLAEQQLKAMPVKQVMSDIKRRRPKKRPTEQLELPLHEMTDEELVRFASQGALKYVTENEKSRRTNRQQHDDRSPAVPDQVLHPSRPSEDDNGILSSLSGGNSDT